MKAEQDSKRIKADHYRPTSCLSNETVITNDTVFHLNMAICKRRKASLQGADSYRNLKAICYFTYKQTKAKTIKKNMRTLYS